MNSLALQAVLDQWTSNVAEAPTQHLSSLYWQNEVYVKEVVRASRNLLRQVVDGLLPDDYLKHVPVRTFFRVLSGAMFLLKVRKAVPVFIDASDNNPVFRSGRQGERGQNVPGSPRQDHQGSTYQCR